MLDKKPWPLHQGRARLHLDERFPQALQENVPGNWLDTHRSHCRRSQLTAVQVQQQRQNFLIKFCVHSYVFMSAHLIAFMYVCQNWGLP